MKMNGYCKIFPSGEEKKALLTKEWLVGNGLGGYASNTIPCTPTRKYHGLLVAALPRHGRSIMLNHLVESVLLPSKREIILQKEYYPEGEPNLESMDYLEEFYLDQGLPVWRYNFEGILFEKRVFFTHLQNTVHCIYSILNEGSLQLKLIPLFNFRTFSDFVNKPIESAYRLTLLKGHYEVSAEDFPSVQLFLDGENAGFNLQEQTIKNTFFKKEAARGEPAIGEFWSPGSLQVTVNKNRKAAFLASIESWDDIKSINSFQSLTYEKMRREQLLKSVVCSHPLEEKLLLAADQFIIEPRSRRQDKIRANALGDEVRTVVAGYHWFGDWGRDTMICLEGLTLSTGRYREARWILRTFAHYVKDGLIPNMFPEGKNQGLYHTADASLWFFHALHRYLQRNDDEETLQIILPKLVEIYEAHCRGTHFGIYRDEEDGLLIQGAEGYQLTWMDAKVGDWVVTPRRGKAVEINALWYNALRLLAHWLEEAGQKALSEEVTAKADLAYNSFNQKFWNEKTGCLYDVLGKEEAEECIRPNQLLAISLDYPILEKKRWEAVFKTVTEQLLTPMGLRTLSPGHKDYKGRYGGDLRARDAAYHQGTVWPWLIGPYIDVWLKLYPKQKETMREYLLKFEEHLVEAGVGYISEICDAEAPFTARGCIAQGWSIAEIFRCLCNTRNHHKE